MPTLIITSYAKLNLFLKVVGRRPDGYHKLVSIFHRISLHDTLHLTRRKQGFLLRCSKFGLSCGEDNLITRAYRLLQHRFPTLGGVSVRLRKNIPLGGGLGGGSSNAASFLLGMKKLYHLDLSNKELMRLGLRLGADVPFFLMNSNQAIVRGIGEKLVKRPIQKKKWFVLIVSIKGLATRKVYQNLPRRLPAVSLTKIEHAVKLICNFLEGDSNSSLGQWLCNDLEQSAFCLRPSLRKLLDRFQKLDITTARMSGSGPTLFAILSSRNEAIKIARKWQGVFCRKKSRANRNCRAIVCHTA
jgi:4-diphosphocytidyl-2-C-methyl-D-erythritol kinase